MCEDLNFIINHVFLPPKLPQIDDSNAAKGSSLLEEVLTALKSFQAHIPEQERSEWIPCIKMIRNMLQIRDHFGGLVAKEMETTLRNMADGDILTLHIRCQNAGLIVRRYSDEYSFESFEVSPAPEAVTSTKGRLRRCFPGPAVAISQDRIADTSFLEPIVDLLVQLDAVTPEEVQPTTIKSHSKVIETRDTVHPRFVTEMLTGLLRAIGQPHDVTRIYKHTRDDVLWKNAFKPWRRCPSWLLLRVALQTSLMQNQVEEPHVRYKSFMLFFMAQVLRSALKACLSSDTIFMMTAKITRRALKLGAVNGTAWLQYVATTTADAQQQLSRRWVLLEKHPDLFATQGSWDPSQLSFLSDTGLRLSRLRPYLAKVRARLASPPTHHPFTSDCGRRISRCSSSLPELSIFSEGNGSQVRLSLIDLELWVGHSIDDWLRANMEHQDAVTALAALIDTYISAASLTYKGMPEDISLMILTSMDLWAALDKLALHHCALLHKYSPEFPPSLFEPLLLPQKSQMERLLRVEQYLDTRRAAAIPQFPSMFRSVDTTNSFPVQYIQQSPRHEKLQRKIEEEAKGDRARKISELTEKRQQYHKLITESEGMSCQYVNKRRKQRIITKHSGSCQKCELKSQAEQLTIDVHEWPLPERKLQAKAAVFELDVPIVVSKWRDITYRILVDLMSPKSAGQGKGNEQKVYNLWGYAGVQKFIISRKGRLQLASKTKPFVVSHYRHQTISQADESNVCVNNGLHYIMYDSKELRWTEELLNNCGVREECTPKLPAEPYSSLQYAVSDTVHTSNEVIASQAKCPEMLTMHEFYAFGTLRSGHRLQWRNIARELTTHILNLNCHETHALIMQAAWQVGPSSKRRVCRESHVDLEEVDFGKSLLSTMEDALGTIEGNWQGATTVRTLIALATRLLSLSLCEVVREGCFHFLRKARTISLRWTREVGQKLQDEQEEEERRDLNTRTLEMALTCYGTFDVDLHHLPALLESDESIAVVTECSIVVHDRCPSVEENLCMPIRTQLQRYRRLSCVLEPILRKRILEVRKGLDITIGRLWMGYVAGSPWSALEMPSERWLVTETSSECGLSSMMVHYNLLDGTLLVNGSLLTRLPRSYESHSTFQRLFGEKVIDVVPSSISGMVYEARNELFHHRLYFAMYESELIIRASQQGQVYELLPVDALAGDLPQAFIRDYAHWLHIETGSVEYRALIDAWTADPHNWTGSGGVNMVLERGSVRLIDIHTSTAKAVATVLSPLEQAAHIHTMLHRDTAALEVHLPRLKLDFFLRKGATQLESKQFRGMVVDSNQSFGTLTGLANKLVLRGITDSSRSVIIPHGDVTFESEGRVSVNIDPSTQHISYHLYHIDMQLGRLVDNGSLKSRLFKCYLHAVTAHCLTDELTGRTGTEEALSILACPSIQSSLRLGKIEIDLLELLAHLTPRRHYYPRGLRVMQEVEWQKLSPISQHPSFLDLVHLIFERARTLDLFYDKPTEFPSAEICGDSHLLKRAAVRDSVYRVFGFGAEHHSTKHDVNYIARDNVSNSTKEARVCHTARLVDSWPTNLKCCSQLLREIESWGKPLDNCETEESIRLGFDVKYLKPLATFLPEEWCKLQTMFSCGVAETDKYKIMIFLSTLTYSQHAKQDLIHTLLAFATVPELRTTRAPDYSSFQLSHGYDADKKTLVDVANNRGRAFHSCPQSKWPRLAHETLAEADVRRRDEHQAAAGECRGRFVDVLICQWPEENVRDPVDIDFDTYIKFDEAMEDIRIWFCDWYRNAMFKKYIGEIQEVLNDQHAEDQELLLYTFVQPHYQYSPKQNHIDFSDIMSRSAPSLPLVRPGRFDTWVAKQDGGTVNRGELQSLLSRLRSKASGGYERRYANDLTKSFDSLFPSAEGKLSGSPETLKPLLEEHLTWCKKHVDELYRILRRRLEEEMSTTHEIAFGAKMWPRLSTVSLLQCLARGKVASLRDDWKSCLIMYAMVISNLQRAQRLLTCLGKKSELVSELANPGHQGWDPVHNTEWLLFEIENNILIRQVQAQIAQEMMSPSSGSNSIMQLNMGEGKSSVIVPIVAAALADGTRLVRVVVLKSLWSQMFQVLLRALGGMLGRRIYHMPISRSVRVDVHKAREIQSLLEDCMRTRGILLVQPEHLLSFELMGPERLLSGESELGKVLMDTQRWLEDECRDILDESDEILSVRFELIYTMGTQRAIEFSPDRWTIIEHVLGLVGRFAQSVLQTFPHGVELGSICLGSFPRIRILQSSAANRLLEMIVSEMCEAGVPGVPVWNLPEHVRAVLFSFLTDINMDEADTEPLRHGVFSVDSTRRSLLLLRGLIAGGVLSFALQQKRWRVNYGLDLSRTMLAVPYRAKDTPATRAEFSHPDATIVLTCLSYYYGGLADEQLYTAFEKLFLSDHAQDEYEYWVHDAPELPSSFRQLTGINLSDPTQCSQMVFPHLRFAKGAVDFYMSHIVFPKEMKEFPHKLSSSGWDIARTKGHPTTGFSGTNDSRYILPLSVEQCDLPAHRHTNAAVLDCLLRSENTFKHAMEESGSESLDAESLLRIVVRSDPPVRVILDVGAQVLEWKNEEVAQRWLLHVPEAQAAIFFDDQNDLSVLTRDGITEPLMISSFAQQMDECLVYLDEAHTRGTDLKLPTNYRAAVTLGPDLTKDRLVQACMRMRKLGKGQSVMFCGSLEVERKILRCSGKTRYEDIMVSDVLHWSILETCIHTKKCIPLWATQGMRFQRRHIAWAKSSAGGGKGSTLKMAKSLLEVEAQSLQDRYGIEKRRSEEQVLLHNGLDKSLSRRKTQLNAIRAKCQEFELASFNNATLQEEQERELSPENEQERQVERPSALPPCNHSVHGDVRSFVRHGILDRDSDAFQPAFELFSNTSARNCLEAEAWLGNLLVTADFARTVHASEEQHLDSFLRPVHWVLSGKNHSTVDYLVVSPFEAHELLPSIRKHKAVTLHVYSPRVSVSVRTLEDLSFCAIPALPNYGPNPPFTMLLNLFAGQLYLKSHEDYLSVCRFLGLAFRPPHMQIEVACDGFISPASRLAFDAVMERECPFTTSPVGFLRIVMAIRRKEQSFQKSHLGRILQADLLAREEFQGPEEQLG